MKIGNYPFGTSYSSLKIDAFLMGNNECQQTERYRKNRLIKELNAYEISHNKTKSHRETLEECTEYSFIAPIMAISLKIH